MRINATTHSLIAKAATIVLAKGVRGRSPAETNPARADNKGGMVLRGLSEFCRDDPFGSPPLRADRCREKTVQVI